MAVAIARIVRLVQLVDVLITARHDDLVVGERHILGRGGAGEAGGEPERGVLEARMVGADAGVENADFDAGSGFVAATDESPGGGDSMEGQGAVEALVHQVDGIDFFDAGKGGEGDGILPGRMDDQGVHEAVDGGDHFTPASLDRAFGDGLFGEDGPELVT